MKRIILIFNFAFCFAFPLFAVPLAPIEGLTPEKLLGGAENLKIVTTAKEVTVYRVATGVVKDSVVIDGLKCGSMSAVSGPEEQKVVAALSDATNFGVAGKGPFAHDLTSPDVIMRFKTDAGTGTVDIIIGFKSAEMAVCRDDKIITRRFDKIALTKNNFDKDAAAAFTTIAKKAFPDDPEIKALPPPMMSTVDLITALETASAAYYDQYHAIPDTPENYVVTAALTGKTRDHIAYIELNPDQISRNGEVLDEWGTPLRFIFTGDTAKLIQSWSAGKDKIFGTSDDIPKPQFPSMPAQAQ